MSSDWNFSNTYLLILMSLGYIVGELAHFLINTTSRAVARDIHYGDKSCYFNTSFPVEDGQASCGSFKDETNCTSDGHPHCEWNYNGLGLEYQVLAGPAFIAVFTIFCIIIGFTSDRIRSSNFGRHRLMSIGVIAFSISIFLMGCADSYWQLVILRMGIAAGEAVCRPISGSLIAEVFTPSARGLANGIFSWGVYYGYGLAYVVGIYLTQADVQGYGWRASYVLSALPGFIVGILLATTVKDPFTGYTTAVGSSPNSTTTNENNEGNGDIDDEGEEKVDDVPTEIDLPTYFKLLAKSFCSPAMLLLLLAAAVRHTGGYSWAYNTRPYFQNYHPEFDTDLGYWLLGCSIGGGSFGVFFGGFLSDRLVKKLGLHSRLWVLSACTLIATPFASMVLYLDPPYALICLIFYYLWAETWFAILFTVIVEVCDPQVRATCIALFLFLMNNIGGNLPVIVDPISKAMGYREALYLVWPGSIAVSSVLFFIASLPLLHASRRRHAE